MRRSLAIVVPLLLVFFLWPSASKTHEERIQSSIRDVAEATRRGHAGNFMDEIAESFSDDQFTRKSLHGMLLREFLNGGGTAVHLGPIVVQVDPTGTTAAASVSASFPGAFLETTLKATELHFELDYVLENDSWRIVGQRNSAAE